MGKKNKNKNKIAPEGAATAAANGSDGAANAPPSSSSTAPSQSASAPRHSSAHKATNKQAAAASTAHTQAAASTPSAPMPALLTRYGVGGDDDDDAPLPRGPIKRTLTHTASTSAAAADSADKTATATEDGQQAMQDDVLFGHKRSAKEERRLAAKKRKAASSTRSSDGSARPSSHKSKKHRGGMTVDTEGDMSEPIDLFTGTTASQHLSRLSDPLSHSTLKAGMVVLGAIRAINEVDLTVQLPHGLTGYVSMREISDPLAEMVDKYIEQGEKAEAKAAGQTVDATNEDGDEAPVTLPELNTFMRVGQLVPCYILSVGTQLLESSSASSTKHSGAHVSKNRNKRIEISMRASLLNQNLSSASLVEGRAIQGAIKSVQEKGYIVDVGVSSTGATAATLGSNLTGGQNITAFLPFNKAPSSELLPPPKRTGRVSSKKSKDAENARRLPIGMPISALISNAQNKRVIVLDAQPSVVNTAVIRNAASKKDTDADEDDDDDDDDASAAEALKNSIGFTNLQPGMLVKATVIQVISDASGKSSNHRMSGGGLYVRFLDFFSGIIDNLHSSPDAAIAGSLDSLFHVGQKITARILYINFLTKKIGLSALPHILEMKPFEFPGDLKCGDRIEQSIVTKVESKQGIYLRLPVAQTKSEEAEGEEKKLKQKSQAEKKSAQSKKGSVKAEKAEKKVKQEETTDDEDEDEDEDESDAEKESNDSDSDVSMSDAEDMKAEDDEEEDNDNDEQQEVSDEEEEEIDVTSESSLSAWAHISRISDEHIAQVPKDIVVGRAMPCRILNFHYLDGLVHVSTQPRVLEQSVLFIEDIQPGMDVQGEVVSIESFGVLLKLTHHLTALIPTLHLSDVHLKDPSKRFEVGQKLKARVLYVEEASKKIIVTLKKSLLNSNLPLVKSYAEAKEGMIVHGYIGSIQEYGLIVELYNKVHGLITTSDLIRSSFLKAGQKPEEAFKKGEVHKVRIVQVEPKKKRIQLSLGLQASKDETSDHDHASQTNLPVPGQVVSGTVKEVKKDGLIIALDEEKDAEEKSSSSSSKKKKKQSSSSSTTLAFLPSVHLTDHLSLSEPLLHAYPVGSHLPRLLCLHQDRSLRMLILSIKPSLLRHVPGGQSSLEQSTSNSPFLLPSSSEALQPGSLLIGFVKSVTDFGVFVGFLDGLSGLAPRNMLSDTFLAGDLSAAFTTGQTVQSKVVAVEHDAEDGTGQLAKLTLTLKPSSLFEPEQLDQAREFEGFFAESFFADTTKIASANFLAKQHDSGSAAQQQVDWTSFPIAGAFDGKIAVVKDGALVLTPATHANKGGDAPVHGVVVRPYHTNEPMTKKQLKTAAAAAGSSPDADVDSSSSPSPSPAATSFSVSQAVHGKILDVDPIKKIVDVSQRPELVQSLDATSSNGNGKGGKKRKSTSSSTTAAVSTSLYAGLKKGASVLARVQLVRKQYVVLSIPSLPTHPIGFALTSTSNARFNPHAVFVPGQEVKAVIHSVPRPNTPSPSDRLLLVLDLSSAIERVSSKKDKKGKSQQKKQKSSLATFIDPSIQRLTDLQNGRKILVKIRGMTPSNLSPKGAGPTAKLEVEIGSIKGKPIVGSVHISELEEPLHQRSKDEQKKMKSSQKYHPFVAWCNRIGEVVPARIMSVTRKNVAKNADGPTQSHIAGIDLSLRKSMIEMEVDDVETEDGQPQPLPHRSMADLHANQIVQAYVKDMDLSKDGSAESALWLMLAPGIKARLRCNELSFPPSDPTAQKQLKQLHKSFEIGQALTVQILAVYPQAKLADVALLPLGSSTPRTFDPKVVERVRKEQMMSGSGSSIKPGMLIHDLHVKSIIPGVGLIVAFVPGHHHHHHHSSSSTSASPIDPALSKHQKFARVHLTDLADKWSANPLAKYKVGQRIPKAFVLNVTERSSSRSVKEEGEEEEYEEEEGQEQAGQKKERVQRIIDLSLRPSRLGGASNPSKEDTEAQTRYPEIRSFEDVMARTGQKVQGYIQNVSKGGVFVWLSHDIVGRCMMRNLSGGYVSDVTRVFRPGQFLPAIRILKADPQTRHVELSLRPMEKNKLISTAGPDGKPLYTFDSLKVDDIVKGYVKQVKPYGVFIKLRDSPLTALCHITEVSDDRISPDLLQQYYEVGDKVRAKVIKIDRETKKISLGLKAKYFEGLGSESEEEEEEEDEDADMRRSYEQQDEEEEDEDLENDAESEEEEEQLIDEEEDEEDEEGDSDEEVPAAAPSKAAKAAERKKQRQADTNERPSKKSRTSTTTAASTPSTTSSAAAAATSLPSSLLAAGDEDEDMVDAPALDLNASFSMLTSASASTTSKNAGQQESEVEDSDLDSDEEDGEGEDSSNASKKKSRRAKSAAKKAEEHALQQKELAILDPNAQPETAEDYERLLVSNPQSSMLWIKYMAYQISVTEIDAARKIAQRALKSIPFRANQEKLNVWIALLNLENMYGNEKTMQETFNKALQYNEPLTVYMEVAKIYAATKKVQLAIETYEAALKKFHAHPSIWLNYVQFLYTIPARIPEGRELLKRALQRLPQNEHLSLIMKVAQLEFHVAHNVDRGRTLLEGVMSNYPKRVDLWNVYVDMECKLARTLYQVLEQSSSSTKASAKHAFQHQVEVIRRLYDRITSLPLSTKKMKFFFKKYLAFEKDPKLGGNEEERIELVKKKAREYVASKTGEA